MGPPFYAGPRGAPAALIVVFGLVFYAWLLGRCGSAGGTGFPPVPPLQGPRAAFRCGVNTSPNFRAGAASGLNMGQSTGSLQPVRLDVHPADCASLTRVRVKNREAVRAFAVQLAADDRVLAAFLGGSLASGTDDEFSDLDLYVVARPETYDALLSDHAGLLKAMGSPLFHHVTPDFEALGFPMVHFALEGGVSGEIAICHPGSMMRTHGGPYEVLHDPEGILAGVVFPLIPMEGAAQEQAGVAQGEQFHYQLAKIVARVARAPAARRDEAIRALRRAADALERTKER